MHKRVLLAEGSDTVRGVAESALRQNGFEVIAVISGDKALEVLELSRPDLIIVGSELEGQGRKPLYEQIQENGRLSGVPLLLLADASESELPFPAEVIINRPVEPKEFIDKVNSFAGRSAPVQEKSSEANPLSDGSLEDDLLDAALGLDQIDVTDSEVMDKTQVSSDKKKHGRADTMGQYDGDKDQTDSGKVESLLIRDEHGEIDQRDQKSDKKDSLSASGGLEILNDQYGLIDEKAANLDSDDKAHDYGWFINEMQKDTSGFAAPGGAETSSEDLNFSDPSSMVDPVTPNPDVSEANTKAQSQNGGVDDFIDEFKAEIEKIRSTEPESITVAEEGKAESAKDKLGWQDSLEKMTPETINLFAREFVNELAEKIAKLVAAKIDEEKLLNLLKREIIQRIEKNQ